MRLGKCELLERCSAEGYRVGLPQVEGASLVCRGAQHAVCMSMSADLHLNLQEFRKTTTLVFLLNSTMCRCVPGCHAAAFVHAGC